VLAQVFVTTTMADEDILATWCRPGAASFDLLVQAGAQTLAHRIQVYFDEPLCTVPLAFAPSKVWPPCHTELAAMAHATTGGCNGHMSAAWPLCPSIGHPEQKGACTQHVTFKLTGLRVQHDDPRPRLCASFSRLLVGDRDWTPTFRPRGPLLCLADGLEMRPSRMACLV
jgi:hypothetical protein